MTHVEEAQQIAQGPRRRFVGNVVLAVTLVLSLLAIGIVWHDARVRAENAETSAVSFAEQVQRLCETEGSLDLDGRDLCEKADEVVEDPAAPPVPPPGKDGDDGPPPTDAQVRGAVEAHCSRTTCAVPPTMAQVTRAVTALLATGEYDGKDGDPGKDAPLPDPGELQAMAVQAVVDYCAAGPQCDAGKDGDDGPAVEEVQAMVAAEVARVISDIVATAVEDHCAAQLGGTCEGVPGPQGTALPGTYACPEGQFVTGFSIAIDGAVTLTCADLITP